MLWARLTQHCAVRSRTLWQLLMVLCALSLFGLLATHKDKLIAGVYPGQSEDQSVKEFLDYSDGEELMVEMKMTRELVRTFSTLANTTVAPSTTPTPPKMVSHPVSLAAKSTPPTTKRPSVSTKRPPEPIKVLTSRAPPRPTAKNMSSTRSPSIRTQKITRKISPTPYNLGDTYATDDLYVNSKCPNRTRDKFEKSETFKKQFVKTIPVLQWKKHAEWSEYERLRKYLGAQGWMGVTWQILNETLNLMNSTGSGYMFDTWKGGSSCIRCAVVGNGGILNGSRMGKEIDSHDYIFRMNGAITDGFQKDVGNRTSFYFFSTNTMMNSFLAYRGNGFKKVPRTEETRFVLLPDHNRDYLIVRAALTNSLIDQGRDKGKDPTHYFGKNLTTEHFKILHPDFMRYLRNRFLWDPILNTKSRDIYRPSTGASILLAAIHTCDQVSAYGFMTPNYKQFSDHYFDIRFHRVAFFANHNYMREMKLWQRLHEAGVITLYTRN